ncbi:hypothetical protein P154DRAFT_28509 [Amniculicola lignicola CBS 123094]|uniref:Rhodopsin domain-containing protein n=1 Tax=Amniculicola lignicola CBS 123094 TaxID=1392246 RepID=A0A6A5VYC1_9PLEO|nr:hypothetical protein P154DRAFT_28509 [Amniculicola lignicola CBS 123094]
MTIHDIDSIARRGEQQWNIAIAFLAIAWVFVALRMWTRTHVIHNFGWDDGTMILATMVFTVYCATMVYLHDHGAGTHITSVAQLVLLNNWMIVGETTYLLTVMILKLSLGIFFARIVVNQWHLWTIYLTVSINILSSVASFFFVILRCGGDLNEYVYRQLRNDCTSRSWNRFFAFQQAALTTVTDVVFVALPVLILWNTSMDLRTKISVGFILSLATLGCICSIIRFQYVDGLTQMEDFYWNATNIAIWSTIEPGAGIIAGCLATLKPFLKRFIINAQSLHSSSSKPARGSSRSFPSNKQASQQKPTVASNSGGPVADSSYHEMNPVLPIRKQYVIELKSEFIRPGGSTERIFDPEAGDGNWQLRDTERELTLRSTRTRSTRTNRSKSESESDIHQSERPLPPLPPGPPQRGDENV